MSDRTAGSHKRSLVDRIPLEALVPLFAAYFALALLYAWQAWQRETPTIFSDELELTQISRSIAETGHPARRGEPYVFTSLVPYFTAPAWRIASVATAFATLKYIQALVMALAIFPAYGIARFVVSRPWALFAAVGSIAVPALSYSPFLVEEPFAYPIAALAIYLIMRAVAAPSRRTIGVAAASCLLGAATRSQLVSLGGAFGLCLLVLAWRTARARSWRTTWTRWDWTGAIVLAIGAVLVFSAFMGRRSPAEWGGMTAFWKDRIFDYAVWAVGAVAVGSAIVPLIATIAALIRPRSEWKEDGLRVYATVTVAALVSLVWYTGIKGAFLSTVFASRILERNLIYLYPLLMVGTAIVLSRRTTRWWAVVPAAAVVLYIVTATPIELDYPYYEAHGLSILAFANRELEWSADRIGSAIIVATLVGALLLAALRPLSRWRPVAGRVLAVVIAGVVIAWSLTAEIYAARGERAASSLFAASMFEPHNWVDRATGGGSVVELGQQVTDPTGIWLIEFWNRSVKKSWTTDGSGVGPGPTLTPDLVRPDGTLAPSPETDYALTYNVVALQAPLTAKRGQTLLYRLGGRPLKLAYSQAGVFEDGWMGRTSSYNRFTGRKDGPSYARIELSRAAFCTTAPIPGGVIVKVGPLVVGSDRQPAIGRVTAQRLVRVRPCSGGEQTVLIPAPRGPWRAEVTADTFVPADIDSRSSDRRTLGVQITYGSQPR